MSMKRIVCLVTIIMVSLVLLLVCNFLKTTASGAAVSAAEDDSTDSKKAVIKVPVAGVHERADADSPLHTQALLNEVIEVLAESGSFVLASVPDGYEGYISKSDITFNLSSVHAAGGRIVVSSVFAAIRDSSGNEILLAPMGSVFFGKRAQGAFLVTLPQNTSGYISETDALFLQRHENIAFGAGESFAASAKKFMGTRYLWGGCSGRGIDCSGLTHIAAKMNGLKIPRDAAPQSETGVAVGIGGLAVGDLLFFGSDAQKSEVTHTGIYAGSGDFIHSSGSNGVHISSLHDEYYISKLISARRHF